LNKPMISAFARVLKCKLNPTTAADVSAFVRYTELAPTRFKSLFRD
jgi:hypothetical protein